MSNYLILFHCIDEWEIEQAESVEAAWKEATSNKRHMDYGRCGASIIRLPDDYMNPLTDHALDASNSDWVKVTR
jgi:hypothetical protein